jgi:hypothetical protein
MRNKLKQEDSMKSEVSMESDNRRQEDRMKKCPVDWAPFENLRVFDRDFV